MPVLVPPNQKFWKTRNSWEMRRPDIVTDEQGRRRFHGAFTGGFSAGYYNTCGSEVSEYLIMHGLIIFIHSFLFLI